MNPRALAWLPLALGFALPTSAALAGYTPFANIPQPIGVACLGDGPGGITDRLIVTTYDGKIFSVTPAGVASQLSLAGQPGWNGVEVYLALSPGLGGWATNRVYFVKGHQIYQIDDTLSTVTLFATLPSVTSTHSGVTFDRTGVWGFDMIVSQNNGNVWRINSGGAVSYVGTAGTHHESPRVITNDPLKWGAYAGCITTSGEYSYNVTAFCPDGSVSVLAAGLVNAEAADLRPTSGEVTFEGTPYVYFLSAFNQNRLVAYTAADLPAGSEGDLFVSREYSGGIYRVAGPGAVTTFADALSEHYEGSNFCFFAGTVDTAEECGDGIDNDNDGQVDEDDTDCQVCSDGNLDPGEVCDDGNVVNGDGCDDDCNLEDPCAASGGDTDGDGVCGDQDVCPGHDDNADADGDGYANGCDVCPGFDDDADGDGDGLADGCDACPNDPANDADGDGACGDVDACPGYDDNADADGDGTADGCDVCPLDAEDDADGDGICAPDDFCPYDPDNDADGDGICGDVDLCPLDGENDADGDGVCGDVDECPGFDDNADADGDGLADGCDTCPHDAANDADGDDICGDVDECAGTTFPDGVPTSSLGTNRWADLNGDGVFDTVLPRGQGPKRGYTMEDTHGCSCAQIIDELNLGAGHTKFGCSISAMDDWTLLMSRL